MRQRTIDVAEALQRPQVPDDSASISASPPAPGRRVEFVATAYCMGATTASGVTPTAGVAAADPAVLPAGSVIHVAKIPPYSGVYTVLDTGPMIRGRRVDLYLWNCTEALQFGRRPVDVTVLRLGWDPQMSTPSLLDQHNAPTAPPAAPLPSRPVRGAMPLPPR
jgi:3D (Asp-Asp-Asp) domain-containing protein